MAVSSLNIEPHYRSSEFPAFLPIESDYANLTEPDHR